MARRVLTVACWLAHLVVIWPGPGGEVPDGAGTLPSLGDGVPQDARGAVRDEVHADERRRSASFDELSPRSALDLGRASSPPRPIANERSRP